MDIFVIAEIKCNMPGEIQKVCGFYLGMGNFPHRISFLDGGVAIDEDSTHKIAHKRETGTVNALMCFPAPAVLRAKVGQGIVDDAGTQFCLGGGRGR